MRKNLKISTKVTNISKGILLVFPNLQKMTLYINGQRKMLLPNYRVENLFILINYLTQARCTRYNII
jgi:hypothetical protein